jgi:hypothetical protein
MRLKEISETMHVDKEARDRWCKKCRDEEEKTNAF